MPEVLLTEEERHELVTVLSELDPSAPREKRGSFRRKILLDMRIQKIQDGRASKPERVLMVNVSRAGAALLSPAPLPVGERFLMRMRFNDGGGSLALCTARNCRRLVSGQMKIGAQIVQRIEDESGDAAIPEAWLQG